jgi:hypothetical protein
MIRYEIPAGYRTGQYMSLFKDAGPEELCDSPPYHIGSDLVNALNLTDLHADVAWCLPFLFTVIVIPEQLAASSGLPEFTTISYIERVQSFAFCMLKDLRPWAMVMGINPREPINVGLRESIISGHSFVADESMCLSAISFAIKAASILSIAPELVDRGEFKKRAKMGVGGERVDLFSPRWLGRTYRLPARPPGGGTHASPRAHMRRGHIRTVRCGPGRTDARIVHILPTWVCAEPTP